MKSAGYVRPTNNVNCRHEDLGTNAELKRGEQSANEICFDGKSLHLDTWEVLSSACIAAQYNKIGGGQWRSEHHNWWPVSGSADFCFSKNICRVDESAGDVTDFSAAVSPAGMIFDFNTGDVQNTYGSIAILQGLKECGVGVFSADMFFDLGALNELGSANQTAVIKTFNVSITGNVHDDFLAALERSVKGLDEGVFFQGAPVLRAVLTVQRAILAYDANGGATKANYDTLVAAQSALRAEVKLKGANYIDRGDLTPQQELVRHVLSYVAQEPEKDCSALPNTHPSEDNKQCVCNGGYELRADKSGCDLPRVQCADNAQNKADNDQECECVAGYVSKKGDATDCKPKRTGGGGGKKKSSGGDDYDPFKE